jgi:hypothetical protein
MKNIIARYESEKVNSEKTTHKGADKNIVTNSTDCRRKPTSPLLVISKAYTNDSSQKKATTNM